MLPKFLHYALWFPRRTSNEYKTSGVAWIHYVRFCFMDVIALVGSHLEKIKPRCSDFWLLRRSQSSPLSMNCFTCVTLLYLHSNCCSPTVICAQKKKKIHFQKGETRNGGQRDIEADGGGRARSKQTQKEAERQHIESPQNVWHWKDCKRQCKHKPFHSVQILFPAFDQIIITSFTINVLIASWSPYL